MKALCFIAVLSLAFASSPAAAQEGNSLVPSARYAVKSGFNFPEGKTVNIILFSPDVQVGEQTVGGLDQPHAIWSQKAREGLINALSNSQILRNKNMSARGLTVAFPALPIISEINAPDLPDYKALLKIMVDAAIAHKLFPGNKLPSKSESFDWTLGPGMRQFGKDKSGKQDENSYALFLYSYDNFPSAARNKSMVISSLMGEKESGGTHIGYAGLIDVNTGDLLWLNVDLRSQGDVRSASGAQQRIARLLNGFPIHSNARRVSKQE